jgi:hypothetical protein
MRESFQSQIAEILTEEQRVQFESMRGQRQGRGNRPMAPRGRTQ